MLDDDLNQAARVELLGDATGTPEAAAFYREAQRLLLPAGVRWTDREAYDRRQEAFERIQQKLYGLSTRENFITSAVPADSQAAAAGVPDLAPSEAVVRPKPAAPDLTVWDFKAGLVVRIGRTFTDYDGQEIRAGEVLHLLGTNYFPYESGFTLVFAEKTIRLADIIDENSIIIKNAGNAWFQPLS
jgi:Domain of unknown function (DUF3601)